MSKLQLKKPVFIMFYGFPGSGKTFLARGLAEDIKLATVHGDRIRTELFQNPTGSDRENEVVAHLAEYMAREFLEAGNSVAYDASAADLKTRRRLRDMARSLKAEPLLIWMQTDAGSAAARAGTRDKRRIDDRYSLNHNGQSFQEALARMQNPGQLEDYIVVSGKHTYKMMRQVVFKRLLELGLLEPFDVGDKVAKPSLVNLVPPVRTDDSRRNITIS